MKFETEIDLNHPINRVEATLINFFNKVRKRFNVPEEIWNLDTNTTIEWLKNANYNYKVKVIYDSVTRTLHFKNKIKKNNRQNMKIKFKSIEEVDFTSVFPVISEEEYKLLSEQELIIPKKEYENLISNKSLKLGSYEIPESFIEVLEESLSEIQSKVLEKVEEKFIYAEDVVDVVMAGLDFKKNVILWGRGGHGKSEMTELIINALLEEGYIDNPPFVQAFGDGLTEEKLFGGMNIKKYREHGVIEYLPENSFMNHEIVVFEEIFDAPASVLLSLKDILTSKKFRQGNEVFDIKTKVVIGLTNRSKEEFSQKDDSLKALAERFPLTLKVEWDSYRRANFIKLFKKVLGEDFYKKYSEELGTLANIIDSNNTNGASFVSPRTAISAAELYCKGKKLDYINEIDKEILADFYKKQKDTKLSKTENKFFTLVNDYIKSNDLEIVGETKEFKKVMNSILTELNQTDELLSEEDTEQDQIKIKLNKLNFILSIIDRIDHSTTNLNNYTALKKKVKEILSVIDDSSNSNVEDIKEEAELKENVT